MTATMTGLITVCSACPSFSQSHLGQASARGNRIANATKTAATPKSHSAEGRPECQASRARIPKNPANTKPKLRLDEAGSGSSPKRCRSSCRSFLTDVTQSTPRSCGAESRIGMHWYYPELACRSRASPPNSKLPPMHAPLQQLDLARHRL